MLRDFFPCLLFCYFESLKSPVSVKFLTSERSLYRQTRGRAQAHTLVVMDELVPTPTPASRVARLLVFPTRQAPLWVSGSFLIVQVTRPPRWLRVRTQTFPTPQDSRTTTGDSPKYAMSSQRSTERPSP